jgi:UDP-N-acetylglucosamine 2-epimerase (non-hydrolysing)
MTPLTVLCVAGARPNFMKVAPLLRAFRATPGLRPLLVHTGQHYDAAMSARFFTDLGIPPADFHLEVGSGSHAVQTGLVMSRLEGVLQEAKPGLVVVVGDVNSTVAAALTAAKLEIPVAHVEAGLRSLDRRMPEEINRVVTDAIADILFASEESGRANLLREGVSAAKIHLVGNVMIDTLVATRHRWEASPVREHLHLGPGRPYAVLTLHRPSNVDDPATLWPLLSALAEVAQDIPVVYPVHPRARQRILEHPSVGRFDSVGTVPFPDKGLVAVEPLGYLDFVALLSRARLALTDSGGIQEETTFLGVPCCTLRDTTERPITVSHGTNRVIGTNPGRIVAEARGCLTGSPSLASPPPLWDGHAAERIADVIEAWRMEGGR